MNATITTRGSSKGFLNTSEIQRLAPAVFTDHAAPNVSERYQYVDTSAILATLEGLGYVAVKAGQSVARSAAGQSYTKHVIRVMHQDYLQDKMRMVGDVVPQIILQNSHNRTSAFHLSAGLFRLVCSNGLAVESAGFASVRVLHNDPDIHGHIIDGTNLIREVTENTIVPQIATMHRIELSRDQEWAFARAASVLKAGDVMTDDDIAHLLEVRREEDAGRTMWQVLNRVQENVVKGGYTTTDRGGRTVTARGITSATRDLDFNLRLWTLAGRVTKELA